MLLQHADELLGAWFGSVSRRQEWKLLMFCLLVCRLAASIPRSAYSIQQTLASALPALRRILIAMVPVNTVRTYLLYSPILIRHGRNRTKKD